MLQIDPVARDRKIGSELRDGHHKSFQLHSTARS